MRLLIIVLLLFTTTSWGQQLNNPNRLPLCNGSYDQQFYATTPFNIVKWNNCWGKIVFKDYKDPSYEGEWRSGRPYGMGTFAIGEHVYTGIITDLTVGGITGTVKYSVKNEVNYVGEMKGGNRHGRGIFTFPAGHGYIGNWALDKPHGQGRMTFSDGRPPEEGRFENGSFIRDEKVDFSDVYTVIARADSRFETSNNRQRSNERQPPVQNVKDNARADIERERQQLAEERRRFEEEKRNREQARNNQRINLQVANSQPGFDGDFEISIQTNADTASLKINGEEQGGRADGRYTIKKVARAGQETKFIILAKDINGNTDMKTISVRRQIASSNQVNFAELDPSLIKTQPGRDAVAIIIGIQNYKRVLKAEYANNDAQAFYDYAIRALGVKPENIKLLIDEQADEVEILSAFQNWLPVKVNRQKTEVYVFYSGHGMPSDDGSSLYILPYGADKQFIAKTAINQQEIVSAIQAAKPKSVTMFIDACYSGQIRTGESLIASARPIVIKQTASIFPAEFTVITASQSDQIALSSPDLKHGIFSYYLMKGMEGDADENKDNKITLGELQNYLQDRVGRKAMSVNHRQMPQLIGDTARVLMGN